MSFFAVFVFGIIFIFAMTTLGSGFVFFCHNSPPRKIYSGFLGFSAGIMFSASIWSLLLPSITLSKQFFSLKVLPTMIGFLVGAFFMVTVEKCVSKVSNKSKSKFDNSFASSKILKLFSAITIHNIPEGLAVGFAFGSCLNAGVSGVFLSALGLAIGIGIQNFPEGAAISLPIFLKTKNKKVAFFCGTLSGAVEPLFALIGFFLAHKISIVQPWILAFSAGTMVFEVIDDLLPEAKISNSRFETWGFILGFALMMMLDVLFG